MNKTNEHRFIVAHIQNINILILHYGLHNITPVPKTSAASEPADFRPISVTPIFERLTEKLIVGEFFLHRIVSDLFNDQYALKLIGSTTCALIDLSYGLHMILEIRKFVR
jgi:hypothetical protein